MSRKPPLPNILYVASEAHPLVKTGGLADVAGSLPIALASLGCDLRLLLPAYPDAVANAGGLTKIAEFMVADNPLPITLLEGMLPGSKVKLWLVDYAPAFNRAGNLYLDYAGHSWSDNAQRFALFARVTAAIGLKQVGLDWQPDVVHCNDWQSGLAPALLSLEKSRPATVFTIHNLAYQGLFPHDTLTALDLPGEFWSADALEFHDQLSFVKGGLAFADRLTTVSPNYAREIQTPELGCGLDGLLRHRSALLSGLLNGIDYKVWDPANDPLVPFHYDKTLFQQKTPNKTVLQQHFNLPVDAHVPVIGMIGRLVQQKGIDLVLDALPALFQRNVQLAVLGSGEQRFENTLQARAAQYPEKLGVHIGFDERLAHMVEAGADMFLMPSRFEPCGLNQLYSLRYGTVPIVHRTGGLADTVIDATAENFGSGSATGFVFNETTATGVITAVSRALNLFQDPNAWRRLAVNGMNQVYDWRRSAEGYLEVYRQAIEDTRAIDRFIGDHGPVTRNTEKRSRQ